MVQNFPFIKCKSFLKCEFNLNFVSLLWKKNFFVFCISFQRKESASRQRPIGYESYLCYFRCLTMSSFCRCNAKLTSLHFSFFICVSQQKSIKRCRFLCFVVEILKLQMAGCNDMQMNWKSALKPLKLFLFLLIFCNFHLKRMIY